MTIPLGLQAGLWGLLAGGALVVGAAIAWFVHVPQRLIAGVMAFGSGVLISALSFELMDEAYRRGGLDSTAIGFLAGAAVYTAANVWISRRGGHDRKRSGGQQAGGAASAIVLGALMDGIPESVAIGVSLLGGGGVGVATVAAVFLSNVPESLSAATGLRKAGHSTRWIVGLWTAVALVSAVAAALGYALLGDASPAIVAFIQAFAAGAILTMLADTMMPEAFEHSGSFVGVVTLAGFAVAFLLSTLE